MASVNALGRELVFKVVYYGPGLGGKTSSLQHIHAATKPEYRGKMLSLATPLDRTLYFDFLPIRVPMVRGLGVRFQLFTVPGQVYYNATRKLVLTGVDGLVFVSDSQVGRMDANLETLENLRANLAEHGRSLANVPHVVQHNKRDLGDVLAVEDLDQVLNLHRAPSFGSVATHGEGVFEALDAISKAVVARFEAGMPSGDHALSASIESIEGGLIEALRNANPDDGGTFGGPPAVIASLSAPASDRPSLQPESDCGADAPGELAARAVTKGDEHATFSLAELWPETERATVRETEAAIANRRHGRAVELCDLLLMRVLASTAGIFGSDDAPRDPAAVPMLLGLDGRQYLAFRALVREGRAGGVIEARRALEAFAFAAHARVLRAALTMA
jgi:signal recognition particle receptor subunit beta